MPNYNQYGNYPYGNIYQPYGMNPNYQNSNYGQQVQPQVQQPQANSYYYVNGVIGAKSFQLQPNQTVMLMDSDSPMCYMKQSNGMGQSTLRYFKLVEVNENDLNTTKESKNTDMTEYVLKADFDIFTKRLDELSKKIEKPYKTEKNNEKGGN